LSELLKLRDYQKFNAIEGYSPYPFQKLFHHAPHGHHKRPYDAKGKPAPVRGLICGNKTGKTFCGAAETSYHLSGEYPEWWEGERFSHPVEWLVAGKTNDKVRDICQRELFGEPTDERAFGTGSVPLRLIGKTTRKPGVPGAFDKVLIKHISGGWSKVSFQAYEQSKGSFMGIPIDGGWMDEEPPIDVFNQFVRGTIAKEKSVLILTFTPEEGATELVYQWLNELGPNQGLVRAGWKDADHIWNVPGKVDELKSLFPKYEHEMRENGEPVMGTGRVFDTPEDEFTIDPIEVPAHWKRIVGFDYGMDHPSAAVWLAWDTDTDTKYVYDVFRKSDMKVAELASVLKRHGNIPVAYPHDMMKREPKSGQAIKQLFVDEGVNMLPNHFTNPPDPNKKEGTGGNSIMAGVIKIQEDLTYGRAKVFSIFPEFFEEYRNYHTENGQIVAIREDLMSAWRYAFMSVRFAQLPKIRVRSKSIQSGVRLWR